MKSLSKKLSILSNKRAFCPIAKTIVALSLFVATTPDSYAFDSMLKSSGRDDCATIAVEAGDSIEFINRSSGVKNQSFEIGFTNQKKKVDFSFELKSDDPTVDALHLTMRQEQSNFGEFDHSIYLLLDIAQGENKKSVKLDKNIGINGDPNFVRIEIYDQGVYISTGKESLTDRISLPFTGFYDRAVASFPAGGNILRRLAAFDPDGYFSFTDFNTEEAARTAISELLAPAKVAGIWEMMDYNVEASQAQVGGNYRIAIVPDEKESIEIIYLDGAKKLHQRWEPGMVKGWLQPTIFAGNYDLIWLDAEGYEIGEGCNARLEGEDILSLEFPLQKSQMRFVRQK